MEGFSQQNQSGECIQTVSVECQPGWRKRNNGAMYSRSQTHLASVDGDRLRIVIATNPAFLFSFPESFGLVLLQNGGDGRSAAAEGSRGLVRVVGRAGDGGQAQGRPRHS